MASGFITLPDGRCLSRRWSVHDVVVRSIADAVSSPPLREWLLEQLPGPDDEEELGYGAWLRVSDDTSIVRVIDLRQLTPENQDHFCEGVKRAADVPRDEEWHRRCLRDFADMVARMERGEPPLSKSDLVAVLPLGAERVGPGWPST